MVHWPVARTQWQVDFGAEACVDLSDREQVDDPDEANCVSSLLADGKHAPVLDVDVPARLVESSTPGHSHLYVDVALDWDDYVKVLKVLGEVGIVDPMFVDFSIARGATFARKQDVVKGAGESYPEDPSPAT